MSKISLSISVIAATIVALMALFFFPLPDEQPIQVVTVQQGMLRKTCMLEGQAVQGKQQLILSPAAGRLVQTYVKSGDRVHQGQLLARLDTQAEEMALAVLENQIFQLNMDVSALTAIPGMESLGLNEIVTLQQQKQMLLATIAGKYIRSAEDGTVENLYASAGDYLQSAGIIGVVCGAEPEITAYWREQNDSIPSPGMAAWWCDSLGNGLEPLVLESVGTPVLENGKAVYPLTFRMIDENRGYPSSGTKAPVRLIMNQLPVSAVVPTTAIDRDSQIWVVEEGVVRAVKIEKIQSDEENVQVGEELLGIQVILEPESLELSEGMNVRIGAEQ